MMVSSSSFNLSIIKNLVLKEKRRPKMEMKCGKEKTIYIVPERLA